MQTVDVEKLIADNGLEEKTIAHELFPSIKHPELALRRVQKGDGSLDSNQLSKLASIIGCSVNDLYSGGKWKSKARKNLHIFTNGEYRAELNPETWMTTIYHKGSLFFEDVIHSGAISLSEYLKELDLIITKNTK